MMLEMEATFTSCDANKDGVLNCAEFKSFACAITENGKRRYGECTKGGDIEDEKWYEAYNSITSKKDGIS